MAYMTTIDLFSQHANVFDGSAFGKSIERCVDLEWVDELHVENGVAQRRHEAVHDSQEEHEFETGNILGRPEPERHVEFFFSETHAESKRKGKK